MNHRQPLIQDVVPSSVAQSHSGKTQSTQLFFGQLRSRITSLKKQMGAHTATRLHRRSAQIKKPQLIQDIRIRK